MSEQYKRAGVNLEAGYEAVQRMKKHIDSTHRLGVLGSIGGFGGLFDLSSLGLKEPVLVSGTDGVGTKLMIAFEMDCHHTIGIDAVAMCANDVIVQGAAPLFFLDYIAVGKNDPARVEAIVQGVAEGCVQANCALVGGETAEMPDMYEETHYDIAGFCVGAAEKSHLLSKQQVVPGDVLIALASSGCHSNGFSLIRQIVMKDHKLDLHSYSPDLGKTMGEELLTPTRIYVRSILSLLDAVDRRKIHGMAHITGGGFYENLPRMMDPSLGVAISKSSLQTPPIFSMLQRLGNIEEDQMYNVFNMGVGYVLAVESSAADEICRQLKSFGEETFLLGEVNTSGQVSLR